MTYGITIIETTNNDGVAIGIDKETDGTYTALTRAASKNFKTLKGATKWINKFGYAADGTRIK